MRQIVESAHRPNPRLIFDSDPKAIVERLIELVKKDREETNLVFKNYDYGMKGNQEVIL